MFVASGRKGESCLLVIVTVDYKRCFTAVWRRDEIFPAELFWLGLWWRDMLLVCSYV